LIQNSQIIVSRKGLNLVWIWKYFDFHLNLSLKTAAEILKAFLFIIVAQHIFAPISPGSPTRLLLLILFSIPEPAHQRVQPIRPLRPSMSNFPPSSPSSGHPAAATGWSHRAKRCHRPLSICATSTSSLGHAPTFHLPLVSSMLETNAPRSSTDLPPVTSWPPASYRSPT
jgi:hypothetical protein